MPNIKRVKNIVLPNFRNGRPNSEMQENGLYLYKIPVVVRREDEVNLMLEEAVTVSYKN
jgi:hypothetical protein